MNREKTIKEWFQDLEEPYRSQALNNCDPVFLKLKKPSASDALLGGFTWINQPEGHDYWSKLHYTLLK